MTDEIHMRTVDLFRGDQRFKDRMRLVGGARMWQPSESGGDPMYMGIDRERWLPTGEQQHTGDGLGANPRKFRQKGAGGRHGYVREQIQTETPVSLLQCLKKTVYPSALQCR
jgi:hypothetical protein